MGNLLVIERILRDRDGIWRQIAEERGLRKLTTQMLVSSVISLALYGAVLGFSNSLMQALSSTVKLPLLFLATLAICLPTLYLFNLVFGARLSVMQAVTLILVSVTVTSVLTLAFAPISLFFLISAHSYSFFKLLNVSILVLTALVGLRFLTLGMRTLNEHQLAEAASAPTLARPVDGVEPVAEQLEPVLAGAVPATTGNGGTTTGAPAAQTATATLPKAPPVPAGQARPAPAPA